MNPKTGQWLKGDLDTLSLPQQTNDILKLVNNHSKQTGDVTSQYAYIECFQSGDCGILPLEYDLASIFTSKT